MIRAKLRVGAEIYIVTPLDRGLWAVDEVSVINDDGTTICCTSRIYDRGVMFVAHTDAFVTHEAANAEAVRRSEEEQE